MAPRLFGVCGTGAFLSLSYIFQTIRSGAPIGRACKETPCSAVFGRTHDSKSDELSGPFVASGSVRDRTHSRPGKNGQKTTNQPRGKLHWLAHDVGDSRLTPRVADGSKTCPDMAPSLHPARTVTTVTCGCTKLLNLYQHSAPTVWFSYGWTHVWTW